MLNGVDKRKAIKLVHACINAIGTPIPDPVDRPGRFWSRHGVSVNILGTEGTRSFKRLVQLLMNKGRIAGVPLNEIYAEKTIEQKTQHLISTVVDQHDRFATKDQIAAIYDEWVRDFEAQFPTTKYYVVVANVKLANSLQIGQVAFRPLTQETQQEVLHAFALIVDSTQDSQGVKTRIKEQATEVLNVESNDALAEIELENVDRTFGYQLCLTYTQSALNVLRFYGYFLYSRAQKPHIDIRGQLYRDRLGIIAIAPQQSFGMHVEVTGPIVIYDLSDDNRQKLEELGLSYVSHLLAARRNDNLGEVEASLLAAIEWAGRGAQSVEPEARYLNLWIAIETLLTCDDDKTRQEGQGQLIALRASLLLPMKDDKARIRVQNLWNDKLYQVRNDLVHRGGSADLDEFLPKLEFYAPVVILRCIEELSHGQTWPSKTKFLDWVESRGGGLMSETSSQLSPEQFDRLLKEYEICREEASRLESHIWQTLSILGVASGVGLVRLASGATDTSSYPGAALMVSAFAIAVSFVWLRFANRWWSIQHLMFERMREIERNTSFRQSAIVSERDVEMMSHIRYLQIRGRWHKRVLNRLRYSIPTDVQPKEASQSRDYEHRGNKPAAELLVYANVALWLILGIDGVRKYTQSDGSLTLTLFLILTVVAAGLWLWRKP